MALPRYKAISYDQKTLYPVVYSEYLKAYTEIKSGQCGFSSPEKAINYAIEWGK